MNYNGSKIVLSLEDTNILKGFALLLLLVHHLFQIEEPLYDDFHLYKSYSFYYEFGKYSKLCVSIFVFLSGYGLTIKAKNQWGMDRPHRLKDFYWHRITKLYTNFWIIWFLFVPISVLVFHRSFSDVYGEEYVLIKGVLDFFGLMGARSYAGSWWFMGCILFLYLLFPFLYKSICRNWMIALSFAFAVSFFPYFLSYDFLHPIRYYIITFCLGISLAISTYSLSNKEYVLCIILFFVLSFIRVFTEARLLIDSFLSLLLICIYSQLKIHRLLRRAFYVLGIHSMNIFLFHCFIYQYWFHDFIYLSRSPIIIFLLLLVICLCLSISIEWSKNIVIYYSNKYLWKKNIQ